MNPCPNNTLDLNKHANCSKLQLEHCIIGMKKDSFQVLEPKEDIDDICFPMCFSKQKVTSNQIKENEEKLL